MDRPAFRAVRDYLSGYAASGAFTALRAETRRLLDDLAWTLARNGSATRRNVTRNVRGSRVWRPAPDNRIIY